MTLLAHGLDHRTAPNDDREGEACSPEAQLEALRRMRSSADQAREIEMARARKRLARGEDPVQVLEALGLGLTNKLLHSPMRAISQARPGDREALARTLEALYVGTTQAAR